MIILFKPFLFFPVILQSDRENLFLILYLIQTFDYVNIV